MSHTSKNEFDQSVLESLQHTTPFFLFSRNRLVEKFKEFQTFFPGSIIHYAMKANSEPEILKLLFNEGCGFEVASVYELHMLKDIGVPGDKIIYGSSVKPSAHIKEFFDYGVNRFSFDSLSELEKIAAVAPGANVYVRITANDTGSVFKFSEKFGTDKENAVPLLVRAKELGLHPYGISFHVGSQANNPMAWAHALESIHQTLQHLLTLDIKLDVINIGGGFPCNYASSEKDLPLKEIAEHTLAQHKKLPYQPKLILEPGRGMVATTGILVASIIGRIERRGNTWLFLDTGVYDSLYEAMAYQGSTRYRVSSMRSSFDSGESIFALAGPTGDSPDIIMREALLPHDMSVGDKLVIHDVGAYSLVVSSRFNGFPRPGVHFI